jgi:hypothetical protein
MYRFRKFRCKQKKIDKIHLGDLYKKLKEAESRGEDEIVL